MKTKTIKLYEYSELSPKAQEKALRDFNEDFDNQALQIDMDNELSYLLEKYGIKMAEYNTYPQIQYSLSHSQGDGAMFEGRFLWKDYRVTVKQQGHYYHYNSKEISMETLKGNDVSEAVEERFNALYVKICKELERYSYQDIDDMQSEKYFIEACNANGYTFRENGVMENE